MTEPGAKEFRNAVRALVGNCSVITVGPGEPGLGAGRLLGHFPFSRARISARLRQPRLLRPSPAARGLLLRLVLAWREPSRHCRGYSGFGGVKGPERHLGAEWETAVTGAHLLKDAPAAVDGQVKECIERATHCVVIGRVRAVRADLLERGRPSPSGLIPTGLPRQPRRALSLRAEGIFHPPCPSS